MQSKSSNPVTAENNLAASLDYLVIIDSVYQERVGA